MRLVEVALDTDSQKLAQYIKQNCQTWLTAVGSHIYYRGTKHPGEKFSKHAYITSVRKDRDSRDSSMSTTDVFNRAITEAGGIANRSNSAFITSEYDTAHSYVNNSSYVFAALPIGDYNYTWSFEMLDWFADAIQKGKILNYVDRKAAGDALKRRYPSKISKISDYDFLDASSASYHTRTPVGTYYVNVKYIDTDGAEQENQLVLPITNDMIVISALAKDILVDIGIRQAADMYAEVMLRPVTGELLLVDAQYYKQDIVPLL